MTDDEGGGLVIHLFGPPPAIEGAPEKAERTGFCYPHSPVLDEVSRTITCKRCKSPLDPFDVLLVVARDYEHWVSLKKESATMRAQLATLQTEEKRVKARTKTHRNKDARAAVADEKRKQLARCLELKEIGIDIRRKLQRVDALAALIATTPVDQAPNVGSEPISLARQLAAVDSPTAMELQRTKEEGSGP